MFFFLAPVTARDRRSREVAFVLALADRLTKALVNTGTWGSWLEVEASGESGQSMVAIDRGSVADDTDDKSSNHLI